MPPQFHGKKSNVMIPVPDSVRKAALKSYKMKDAGFKGGQATGWKRAKQLSTKDSVSIQDLRYIRNWFARHVYTSYPAYQDWKKNGRPMDDPYYHRKHGIIAWQIWGGDPALKWVNRHTKKLNTHFSTDYTTI
jgi:hypothetical protein